MFTGLVENVGNITSFQKSADIYNLTIKSTLSKDLYIGQSVCVNGACLTVVQKQENNFTVQLTSETWNRTAFNSYKNGDPLNLERALTLQTRLDGHIVSGHVDVVGTIKSLDVGQNSATLWVAIPHDHMRYIVEKGSVALDGISLTIASIDGDSFSIALIPETIKATGLNGKKSGAPMNVETDIIGKYIERLLAFKDASAPSNQGSGITMESLMKMGW